MSGNTGDICIPFLLAIGQYCHVLDHVNHPRIGRNWYNENTPVLLGTEHSSTCHLKYTFQVSDFFSTSEMNIDIKIYIFTKIHVLKHIYLIKYQESS